MTDFIIRPAKPGDEDTVVALLLALAEYEKLTHRFQITPEIVRRDYLCERPLICCDLLFEGERPAGIVGPEFRGRRYGYALLANLAKRVIAHDGIGIDWEVLDWNKPSIDFYESIGATGIKNWYAYSLGGEALKTMAQS
jgi:GNAT superfamily N-acetyltransferase